MSAPRSARAWDVAALAMLFTVSGSLHLLRPKPFEQIVPHRLPAKRALVYVSGVVELACAAGLLHPRTRRAAGLASAVTLVSVFPANVQMALDLDRRARRTGRQPDRVRRVAAYLRLPLQVPLVRTALKAVRS